MFPVRLTCSGAGTGLFNISYQTGEVFLVREGLDYESQPNYTVVIHVTDDGSAGDPSPITSEASLFVSVGDVNEAPRVLKTGVIKIPENITIGSTITALQWSDPDRGTVHQFSVIDDLMAVDDQGYFHFQDPSEVCAALTNASLNPCPSIPVWPPTGHYYDGCRD